MKFCVKKCIKARFTLARRSGVTLVGIELTQRIKKP